MLQSCKSVTAVHPQCNTCLTVETACLFEETALGRPPFVREFTSTQRVCCKRMPRSLATCLMACLSSSLLSPNWFPCSLRLHGSLCSQVLLARAAPTASPARWLLLRLPCLPLRLPSLLLHLGGLQCMVAGDLQPRVGF